MCNTFNHLFNFIILKKFSVILSITGIFVIAIILNTDYYD